MKRLGIVVAAIAGMALMVPGRGWAQKTPGWEGKMQMPNVSAPHPWDITFHANVIGDYEANAPGTWTGQGGLSFVTKNGQSDPNGFNTCPRAFSAIYDPRWLLNNEISPSTMVIQSTPNPVDGGTCNNGNHPAENWTIEVYNWTYADCDFPPPSGSVILNAHCQGADVTFLNQYGNVDYFPVNPGDEGQVDFQLTALAGHPGEYQWVMWFDATDVDNDGNENVMTASQLYPYPNVNAVPGM